jgi:sigma-B regulation protein RsbU (phosphoserine phosphatase)
MPGDLALLYTDGITEARNEAGDFFGTERLDQVLCDLPDPITPDAAVESIAKAVARFAESETPADDQTLVAIGKCPDRDADG